MYSSSIRRKLIPFAIALSILIIFGAIFACTVTTRDIGASKTFHCDVKSLNLNTKIIVSDDSGSQLYTVEGNILRFLEDPLTLYGSDDNKLAYASDQYHLINQDSHVIVSNDSEDVELVGNFKLFGDSYDIYIEGQKVAHAKFDSLNTYGTLCDNDGNVIADYKSTIFFNDYTVQVVDNNLFTDQVIIMIFASYYSDQHADSNSN